MFGRKTHQHHGALLAHHIARAQNRGRASAAFVNRSRPASAAAVRCGPGGARGSGAADAHGVSTAHAGPHSVSVSSMNSERPWCHQHGTLATYTTHDRMQTHVLAPFALPHCRQSHGLRLHMLQAAVSSKAFSRKSAAFWALPHAWGLPASHHWAHPRRNWGWPTIDVSSGAGHDDEGPDQEAARAVGGGKGTLVAMVEWDNGSVGEYALRHHPHPSYSEQSKESSGVLCMATLALACQGHARSSGYWQPPFKMLTQMHDSDPPQPLRRAAASAIGCSDANFAASPQVRALRVRRQGKSCG
jgi:hypothetical protein